MLMRESSEIEIVERITTKSRKHKNALEEGKLQVVANFESKSK